MICSKMMRVWGICASYEFITRCFCVGIFGMYSHIDSHGQLADLSVVRHCHHYAERRQWQDDTDITQHMRSVQIYTLMDSHARHTSVALSATRAANPLCDKYMCCCARITAERMQCTSQIRNMATSSRCPTHILVSVYNLMSHVEVFLFKFFGNLNEIDLIRGLHCFIIEWPFTAHIQYFGDPFSFHSFINRPISFKFHCGSNLTSNIILKLFGTKEAMPDDLLEDDEGLGDIRVI